MIIVHTDTFTFHVEPDVVAMSLENSPSGITSRSTMTPDQARKLAAELLMLADAADLSANDGDCAEAFFA